MAERDRILFSEIQTEPIEIESYTAIPLTENAHFIYPLLSEIAADINRMASTPGKWIPQGETLQYSPNIELEIRRFALFTQLIDKNPEHFFIETKFTNEESTALIFSRPILENQYSRIKNWALRLQGEPENILMAELVPFFVDEDTLLVEEYRFIPFWRKTLNPEGESLDTGMYRLDMNGKVSACYLYLPTADKKEQNVDPGYVIPDTEIFNEKAIKRIKKEAIGGNPKLCKRILTSILERPDRILLDQDALEGFHALVPILQEQLQVFIQDNGIKSLSENFLISSNLSIEEIEKRFDTFDFFLTFLTENPTLFKGVKESNDTLRSRNRFYMFLAPEYVKEFPEIGEKVFVINWQEQADDKIVMINLYPLGVEFTQAIIFSEFAPGWKLKQYQNATQEKNKYIVNFGLSHVDKEKKFSFYTAAGLFQSLDQRSAKDIFANVQKLHTGENTSVALQERSTTLPLQKEILELANSSDMTTSSLPQHSTADIFIPSKSHQQDNMYKDYHSLFPPKENIWIEISEKKKKQFQELAENLETTMNTFEEMNLEVQGLKESIRNMLSIENVFCIPKKDIILVKNPQDTPIGLIALSRNPEVMDNKKVHEHIAFLTINSEEKTIRQFNVSSGKQVRVKRLASELINEKSKLEIEILTANSENSHLAPVLLKDTAQSVLRDTYVNLQSDIQQLFSVLSSK